MANFFSGLSFAKLILPKPSLSYKYLSPDVISLGPNSSPAPTWPAESNRDPTMFAIIETGLNRSFKMLHQGLVEIQGGGGWWYNVITTNLTSVWGRFQADNGTWVHLWQIVPWILTHLRLGPPLRHLAFRHNEMNLGHDTSKGIFIGLKTFE